MHKIFVPLFALSASALLLTPALAQQKKEPPKAAPAAKAAPAKAPAAGKKPEEKPASPTAQTYELGKYGDWGAYMSGNGATKICFALSQPKDRAPKGLTRDPAYLFISSRPGQNVRNELSFMMGYPQKTGVDAVATIDGKTYALEAKDKTAFVKNAAEEGRIVEALKSGTKLSVKGTSLRGNDTIDSYSLNGLGKALEKLGADCK